MPSRLTRCSSAPLNPQHDLEDLPRDFSLRPTPMSRALPELPPCNLHKLPRTTKVPGLSWDSATRTWTATCVKRGTREFVATRMGRGAIMEARQAAVEWCTDMSAREGVFGRTDRHGGTAGAVASGGQQNQDNVRKEAADAHVVVGRKESAEDRALIASPQTEIKTAVRQNAILDGELKAERSRADALEQELASLRMQLTHIPSTACTDISRVSCKKDGKESTDGWESAPSSPGIESDADNNSPQSSDNNSPVNGASNKSSPDTSPELPPSRAPFATVKAAVQDRERRGNVAFPGVALPDSPAPSVTVVTPQGVKVSPKKAAGGRKIRSRSPGPSYVAEMIARMDANKRAAATPVEAEPQSPVSVMDVARFGVQDEQSPMSTDNSVDGVAAKMPSKQNRGFLHGKLKAFRSSEQ